MALDRRQHPRHNPSVLIPLNLGTNNEGMLLNLSEGGLAFHVVAPVKTNAAVRLMCMLGPDQALAATGEVTWTSETRKAGGLRFTGLPESSRKLIADWLTQSPLELPTESLPEPLPEPSLHGPRAASPRASADAGAEVPKAMPPPGEVQEIAAMSMRCEDEPPKAEVTRAAKPRTAAPTGPAAAPWRSLSSSEWLHEPAKQQRNRAQASPGTKSPLEWILGAGCVVLAIAALLIWTSVFRSIDGRAGGPVRPSSSAPVQANTTRSAPRAAPPTATDRPSPAPPSVAQGSRSGPASTVSAELSPPPTTQTQPRADAGGARGDGAAASAHATRAVPSPAEPLPSNVSREPGEKELIQALHYLNRTNGPNDTAAAVTWFWQAVQKGNTEAAVRLAGLYLRGDGVAKSCDQARVLLTTAAQKGNREAAQRLTTLRGAGCP